MTSRRTKLDLFEWFSLPRLVTHYRYALICGCGWLLMFMPVFTDFNIEALSEMDSTGTVVPIVFGAMGDALFFQRRFCFEFALLGCLVVFGGFVAWRVDVEDKRISQLSSHRTPDQT